ncbi:hypothetical protein VM1G_10880 [Cytospora mali]|uniref:Rhodopsin domain-containing protein n=1 Tax=Cytospora mali TaxID=578113 RepID=A0A194VIY7_CYTMA|nr:hypothetical protein VM1G_10880 [Valsa mali]
MAAYSPAMIQAFLDGPADAPPNGTTSDFNVQPPYDPQGIAFIVVCLFLLTTTGFLHLALAGFGVYVGCVWATLAVIQTGGFFVHQWNIRLSEMLDLTYRMYIFSICYSGSLGFAKAAILLEWNRIFVPHGVRNRFFWAASILLEINTLLYVSVVVAVICSCTPPQKLWNPFLTGGECLNRQTLDTTAAAFNLVTDFAVFVLPQHKIWSLQMTTSRKIGISVVFSFGLLSCACAIGRIHATVTTVYPRVDASGASGDVSYTVSPLLLWCLAEMTCVFLVFCIPMVPSAFSKKTALGRAVTSLLSWTRIVSSTVSSSRREPDSIPLKG